jgi:hypothetical protein
MAVARAGSITFLGYYLTVSQKELGNLPKVGTPLFKQAIFGSYLFSRPPLLSTK